MKLVNLLLSLIGLSSSRSWLIIRLQERSLYQGLLSTPIFLLALQKKKQKEKKIE